MSNKVNRLRGRIKMLADRCNKNLEHWWEMRRKFEQEREARQAAEQKLEAWWQRLNPLIRVIEAPHRINVVGIQLCMTRQELDQINDRADYIELMVMKARREIEAFMEKQP